jgi:hypothetical protein
MKPKRMEPRVRSARVARLWLLSLAVALLAALPATATTTVLKRAFENFPQGVGDVVLSPVTAGTTLYNNMTTIEDTPGVRIAYAVPGYAWNLMSNAGGGLIRMLTGIMELPAGLVLLFSDADMEPLFDPAEDNEALITYDEYEDIYRVKMGISYTAGG